MDTIKKELIGGDFELDRQKLIGTGSWGNVYLGFQRSLSRPVAIKILKKELVQEENFVKYFQREASTMAKVVDEHIVQVYFAGEYDGSYFFIMEYVPGKPLSRFLERGRKFTVPETIYVAKAVAHALKAAWESPAKIVHRDIKPSNIMVSYTSTIINPLIQEHQPPENLAFLDLNIMESKIKVMDFGLARISKGILESTMNGRIIGTPKYISPEQGVGNPADIRSDIYSLGIVIYETAAGRIPFEEDSAIDLIKSHIHTEPPAPSLFNNRISGNLEAVILKCIQKNPMDRYQNPNELLAALKAVQQANDPQSYPVVDPPGRRATDPQGQDVRLTLPPPPVEAPVNDLQDYLVGGSASTRPQETGDKYPTIIRIIQESKIKYWAVAIALLLVIVIGIIASFTLNNKVNLFTVSPDSSVPNVKFDALLSQARLAIKLKEFDRAKELMMQAAGQNLDSGELKKLIQEYNTAQPCPVQENLIPTIRGMLKHAQMEIADNNFDKARFILSEAYFLDPCSPEIDVVFHEMEAKKKLLQTPSVNSAANQKIEALLQEGLAFLRQKNVADAERKLIEARYLALQNPGNLKELGDAINNLLENIKKESSGK
ncbi:MAG: serine/threonine protein kinase [Planctomycetes bacterium]|nr:serine/threonine protein kinase [Planctomycetota bacterium]